MVGTQPRRHRADNFGIVQHTDFDSVRTDIVKYAVDLLADEGGGDRLHGCYAQRILRNHRRDDAHAVQVVRFDRFQVGLNTGAAGRVGSGDG